MSFTDFLSLEGMRVDSEMLKPWARWVGKAGSAQFFDTFFFLALLPEGQEPDGTTGEADDAGWFSPRLILDGWRAGLVRLVAPTWAQLQRLARCDSVNEAVKDADASDMRPVIGDPIDDERYREFFTTYPTNRI